VTGAQTGGQVPDDALAVVINTTVTEAAGVGFLTLWPNGVAQPVVSNLNYRTGQTVANLGIVKVGAGGTVQLAAGDAAAHVLIDVVGWYAHDDLAVGARFRQQSPTRLLDTRTAGLVALGPNETRVLAVVPPGTVPAVSAVALNVTATDATTTSFVTVYPGDVATLPPTSSLNVVPGEIAPNLVVSGVAADGTVKLFNASGSTHLIVDLLGTFDADRSTGAGRYVPIVPRRLVDSRASAGEGAMAGGTQRNLGLVGLAADFPFEWSSVAATMTVTDTSAVGHLTAWPTGSGMPLASNLNWRAGETRPNLVFGGLDEDGFLSVFNSAGSSHLIVDVSGWFTH
jgi:hypothetical protein